MTFDRWKLVAEMVGIFAVVLSLLLVAVELQQTQNALTSSALQARAQSQIEEAAALYNSEYMASIFTKLNNNEDLSAEDQQRYNWWFRGFNRIQELTVLQSDSGDIGPWVLEDARYAVSRVIGSNQFAIDRWNIIKPMYAPVYREFVEANLD